jgi:hypothetical protein
MSELRAYHGAQDLRLESFQNFNVGGCSSKILLTLIGEGRELSLIWISRRI